MVWTLGAESAGVFSGLADVQPHVPGVGGVDGVGFWGEEKLARAVEEVGRDEHVCGGSEGMGCWGGCCRWV